MIYLIYILAAIGIFFALTGAVGILRMRDALTRMQTSTCICTFGVLFTAIAGVLYAAVFLGNSGMAIKIALLGIFFLVTAPVSAHALAHAAYHQEKGPKLDLKYDDYGEDLES